MKSSLRLATCYSEKEKKKEKERTTLQCERVSQRARKDVQSATHYRFRERKKKRPFEKKKKRTLQRQEPQQKKPTECNAVSFIETICSSRSILTFLSLSHSCWYFCVFLLSCCCCSRVGNSSFVCQIGERLL